MASWNWRKLQLVAVALGISGMPAFAAEPGAGGRTGASHVRAIGPDVQALLDSGLARSESFRELVAQVERTNWIVFALRGRCPERETVACLLHTVVRIHGQKSVRILIDNRRPGPADVEIGSMAHELQHALEATESDDARDGASLSTHFRTIGYTSLKTPNTRAFETEAAKRMGDTVLRELDRLSPRKNLTASPDDARAVQTIKVARRMRVPPIELAPDLVND